MAGLGVKIGQKCRYSATKIGILQKIYKEVCNILQGWPSISVAVILRIFPRRSRIMDYQEFIKMGQKARRETEDFINHHIHDQRRRWPVICHSTRIKKDTVQTELSGTCSHIRKAASSGQGGKALDCVKK